MGWLVAFKSLLGHEPPSLRNKEDHSKNSQVKGLSGSILCDFAHPGKIFLQTILHVFVTRLVARFPLAHGFEYWMGRVTSIH